MDKLYKKATVELAQKLLKDVRAEGDHGFKGKQLTTWNKMRTVNKAMLTAITKQQKFSYSYPTCPRDVVDQFIFKKDSAGNIDWSKREKNPKWSGGTRGGQSWATACERIAHAARDEGLDIKYLTEALKTDKMALAEATKSRAAKIKKAAKDAQEDIDYAKREVKRSEARVAAW